MKRVKQFLAFMLSAMLAAGALQMPAVAGEYGATEAEAEST